MSVRLGMLVTLAACSGASSAAGDRPPPGERLRLMTYNVNFGLGGDPSGIDAIARAAPDVVLLQETDATWEHALVNRLGSRFPHRAFAPPGDRWAARGMGVLSRWPITGTWELVSSAGPFFAWRILIDAPGGLIQLVDVHLHPPISERGSWLVGYFSTRSLREQEALDHLAAIDRTLPTIIAGDFNEEEKGRALAVLEHAGFTNTLPETRPDAPTWRWPVGPITLRMRLDHILHDEAFQLIDADIVDAGRSDHVPVWADLERRSGSQRTGSNTTPDR